MMSADQEYYFQALQTRFGERPPRTLKELQDYRAQLLESFIPCCSYGNILYFELEPLVFLHTSKSFLGGTPLTKLSIHVARTKRTTDFQKNWQFGANPKSQDPQQIFPFITLKDFDHDCLPYIVTSLLGGEVCSYLMDFLRVLDVNFPQPMLDSPLPKTYDPLTLRPSIMFNLERSDEVHYSVWFAQRGNVVHTPRYYDYNGTIFYSMMDLVRIYGDFTTAEEWECMQICQQLLTNPTLMNHLLASGSMFVLNSGPNQSYLETQFILLPAFLSTVLGYISSTLTTEIKRHHESRPMNEEQMVTFSSANTSSLLPVQESVRKAIASEQLHIPTAIPSCTPTDSLQRIYDDFIAIVEQDGIVAYYFKDDQDKEYRIYDLHSLTELVVGKLNGTTDHRNKWTRKWNRSELKDKGIVRKIGDRWMIEANHFLLWCLDSTRFNAELLDFVKPIQTRLQTIQAQRSQFPPIEISEERFVQGSNSFMINPFDGTCTYTEEEALGKVRQWDYGARFLEVRARQQGYHRRVFGQRNNLYEARHLAKIAGPYMRMDNASAAILMVMTDLSDLETDTSLGMVHLPSKGGSVQRYFVTIEYFQHHIWHRLGRSNDKHDKSCRLAIAIREGAYNTDNRVKNGSAQVVEETMQNAIRLQSMSSQREEEERQKRLMDMETNISPMLENNPAKQVKTVVVPTAPTAQISKPNRKSESLEWRKYELKTKEDAETERKRLSLEKEERVQMATIATQLELAKAEHEKQKKMTLKEHEMTSREMERTKQVEFRELTRQTSIKENTRLLIEKGKMEIEKLRIENSSNRTPKTPKVVKEKIQKAAGGKCEVVINRRRQSRQPNYVY